LTVVRAGDDPVAIAAFHLDHRPADAYADAIAVALAPVAGRAHDDVALAASLIALAEQRQIAIAPAQRAAVEAAVQSSLSEQARGVWQGFLTGSVETEAELAGAIAADLTGAGDVRDLAAGAFAFTRGEPVDAVGVTLAAVGLGLTGATVASLGAASPARVGASVLKALYRAQRLPAPLLRQVTRLADEAAGSIPWRDIGQAAVRLDASAIRVAATGTMASKPVRSLTILADDLGALGSSVGLRGTTRVLARSDDIADVTRAARVARHHGRSALGVLALIGSSALTLGGIMATLAGWLIAAGVWIAVASVTAVRLVIRTARWWSRQPPQRLNAARKTAS
jgi:hypothetical protein